MTEHRISKEKTLQILQSYFTEKARQLEIYDEGPDDIYKSIDKECWYVHVPSDTLSVGGFRIVAVSKHTERIVFDGFAG